MAINLILFILITILLIYFGLQLRKKRAKRIQLIKQKFPDSWVQIIKKNVYLYNIIPPHLKPSLHNYIKIFLAEKEFIGKEGLNITEEIKLTIASQACLLLLHNRSNYFPYLKTISVYPKVIILNQNKLHKKTALSGQSSVGYKSGYDGEILLSWYEIKSQSKITNTGDNVVLHEFAHQLDQEFGSAPGIPRLANLQENIEWSQVLAREYQQLCEDLKQAKNTVLNPYGATNQAEFFAVATETFFTKPQSMKIKHPLLYEQLKKYYQLDPFEWVIINN